MSKIKQPCQPVMTTEKGILKKFVRMPRGDGKGKIIPKIMSNNIVGENFLMFVL